jgi:glycosyltransferase involved in cell wall biosynthesis
MVPMVMNGGRECHKPVVYHILRRMRVVIDAVPLLIRSAGVKNYLYHWITHLRRAAGPDAIRTFPALDGLGPLTHEGSVVGRWRTFSGLGALALSNYSPLPVLDWMTRGADIFHATVLVRRPPRRTRLTATIHDMTGWLMPELHPASNLRAERSFAELARAADRLIAVSQCTKDDAVRVLGLAPEKIEVIHSGIAASFFDPPTAEKDRVRARYNLARPFVLFIGTIEPRKNLDTLLDAFAALPSSVREEHDLVIAGPVGWAGEKTKARLHEVRYLGYVPEADLAPLTGAAAVFAYPSLYEGFGFPVAQAMAAGAPVLTSNVSSLPEVAGDDAVLVDPRSVSELRAGLERLLLSASLRSSLAQRARSRAEEFRWESCAAKSLSFFRQVG